MENVMMNELELSAIGEVANISLGNAATSLGVLIRDDIDISIPYVEVKKSGDIIKQRTDKSIITRVDYVKGLQGCSILFLKEEDVKVMTDLMMGSDGHGMFYQQELSELHLSAMAESMNQMMGAAATAMGAMLGQVVDISTPQTIHMSAGEYFTETFPEHDRFIQITFEVQMGSMIKTVMVQLYPYILAKAIADLFIMHKAGIQ
ncbi:MAG TPA: chemotaxis protein CheC [Lachnospiraceae bacterium]|nr:chemotaxis protein CheC [Lachnospiraceae bacterium]HPF30633.1 chemotaxis protein CheC [Lachnospiraceae bacterium]